MEEITRALHESATLKLQGTGDFLHIRRPDEIRDAIAVALQDDSQRRHKRQQYRDFLFFGLDGQASARTKAMIERLLAEGGQANCP